MSSSYQRSRRPQRTQRDRDRDASRRPQRTQRDRDRDASRSPQRTQRDSRSPQRTQRDRERYIEYTEDREVRESIVHQTNSNTPILLTPFTFGMEWEPTLRGQYNPPDNKKHYDRETIFTSGTRNKNLKVSIEDYRIEDNYSDIENQQKRESCKYGIELVIGVLGQDPKISLNDFFQNKGYFMNEIEEELKEFDEKFFEEEKQNIRSIYKREKASFVIPGTFVNCALTKPLTEENKLMYPYIYKQTESLSDMSGRPQVTIGVSYALFIPLLNYYKDITGNYYINLTLNIYNRIMKEKSLKDLDLELNINSKLVCEGFIKLIIYYSTIAASYIQSDIAIDHMIKGPKYFKSMFYLKPRSNLAESYKHLKSEYTGFENFINLVYQEIYKMLDVFGGTINPPEIDSYKSLVDIHLDIIKAIASDNEEILKRLDDDTIYPTDNTNKYQDICAFMSAMNYEGYKKIVLYVSLINALYLIYKILNPQKVVKLKIDRKKIKQDCKFLDGYYYSYEGDSKELIDDLVSKNFAQIINNTVYDFAHTSDPQILEVEKKDITMEIKSICPSAREELFEYIPEDSNLILEIRGPEVFTEMYKSGSLNFYNIKNFLNELFTKIDTLFKNFLIPIFPESQQRKLSESQPPNILIPQGSCTTMFRSKRVDSKNKTKK